MPVNTTLANYQLGALSNAIKAALPSAVDGLSAYGPNRAIDMLYQGNIATLTAPQETTAQGIFDAHDPVYLTVDKNSVIADGTDTATITVTAPKVGAAAITLVCTKPDGTTTTDLITMTNGVGTTTFKTSLAGAYTITLQNPTNRTTDQLTITGA